MNLLNTVEIYSEGFSEEIIGKVARDKGDQVIIATKFPPNHATYSGVIKSAENSLSRLRTEYIDIYQLHWTNPRIPIEETMSALTKLKKALLSV